MLQLFAFVDASCTELCNPLLLLCRVHDVIEFLSSAAFYGLDARLAQCSARFMV